MATSDDTDRRAPADDHRETGSACPECGGDVHHSSHEQVCASCGLVLDEERIDHGPEWREFEDGENRERTGAPLTPTRHDRGLSTELWGSTDANGNPVPGRRRRQLARMKREHSRSRMRSKAERNLAHGLSETRRVASALDLPESIRDQACALFRSAASEELLPGRSIEGIAAASVYAACRCNGLPRTIKEVGEVAAVDTGRVDNGYTVLNRELGIPAQPTRPSAYVPRFASTLDLPERIQVRALELAESAEVAGLVTGAQPSGFAGACIYLACQKHGHPLTQAGIAEVAGASVATIRSHRDRLEGAGIDD